MRPHELASEATACRVLAKEFEGRPEAPVLSRLANEFDRLALTREWPLGFRDEDGRYFRERAAQEVTAAVNAGHPGARLAHLQIAQRYEELSQAIQRRAVERRQA
jgi:TorA maturation chaperone TorD